MTIDQVSPKRREWAGSLRERMKAIDEEYLYLFVQRIPSHAVHGSWVDLLLHHLDEQDDGFVPDPGWKSVDARLLMPIALLILRAVDQYLEQYFENIPPSDLVRARIKPILWLCDALLDNCGGSANIFARKTDEEIVWNHWLSCIFTWRTRSQSAIGSPITL